MKNKQIKVIAFDADDTLWVNETYLRSRKKICYPIINYETPNKIEQELFQLEMKNLPYYGYGIKGFVLSMIETALEISNDTLPQRPWNINIGKKDKPMNYWE